MRKSTFIPIGVKEDDQAERKKILRTASARKARAKEKIKKENDKLVAVTHEQIIRLKDD